MHFSHMMGIALGGVRVAERKGAIEASLTVRRRHQSVLARREEMLGYQCDCSNAKVAVIRFISKTFNAKVAGGIWDFCLPG
jgi:hypothetical protein